jgi:hypothetical protein
MTLDIATLPDDQLQLKQLLVDFQARFDKETGILLSKLSCVATGGRKVRKPGWKVASALLLFDMPGPVAKRRKKRRSSFPPIPVRKRAGNRYRESAAG